MFRFELGEKVYTCSKGYILSTTILSREYLEIVDCDNPTITYTVEPPLRYSYTDNITVEEDQVFKSKGELFQYLMDNVVEVNER